MEKPRSLSWTGYKGQRPWLVRIGLESQLDQPGPLEVNSRSARCLFVNAVVKAIAALYQGRIRRGNSEVIQVSAQDI